MTRQPRKFTVNGPNSADHPVGTVCYDAWVHDYGLASDDTRITGIAHVSVTLDLAGGYPTFTIQRRNLADAPQDGSTASK